MNLLMTTKRFFKLLVLTIVAGALDALFSFIFVDTLHLPLFVDTIFCLGITFYAGPICGVLSAAVLQLIEVIRWTPAVYSYYWLFFFCSALASLTAWLFKKYIIDKHSKTVLTIFSELLILSFIICIVESVSGGIISRIIAHILGNQNTEQTTFLLLTFEAHIKSPLAAAILTRIPINILDRIVTTFAGWGLFLLLSKSSRLGAQ